MYHNRSVLYFLCVYGIKQINVVLRFFMSRWYQLRDLEGGFPDIYAFSNIVAWEDYESLVGRPLDSSAIYSTLVYVPRTECTKYHKFRETQYDCIFTKVCERLEFIFTRQCKHVTVSTVLKLRLVVSVKVLAVHEQPSWNSSACVCLIKILAMTLTISIWGFLWICSVSPLQCWDSTLSHGLQSIVFAIHCLLLSSHFVVYVLRYWPHYYMY